ncbi:MAG: dienelactone hydrolase family protein [Planctomycetota bacterium]|nr:dienelactone hydrolase family protein [Planctomycetota bacterium]
MSNLIMIVAATALLAGCASVSGGRADAGRAPGFHDRVLRVGSEAHRYVVYVPRGYVAGTPMPTIMFLHGKGECGIDGWKQVAQGIGRAMMFDVEAWPFIVIFPQKPDANKQWEEFEPLVMGTLEAVKREYSVDASRTYLTGLSQGGHGTWALGAMHPEVWAALVPVCGYGDAQALAPKVASLPIWCFHGGADDVVKPEQSRMMMAALEKAGAKDIKYTEYPGVNHNSWDNAYGSEGVGAWLLGKRR